MPHEILIFEKPELKISCFSPLKTKVPLDIYREALFSRFEAFSSYVFTIRSSWKGGRVRIYGSLWKVGRTWWQYYSIFSSIISCPLSKISHLFWASPLLSSALVGRIIPAELAVHSLESFISIGHLPYFHPPWLAGLFQQS